MVFIFEGKPRMAKKGSTRRIGRSAKTGKFITVKEARRKKATSVVETIKKARSK
jgi:hypothetical protein